MSFTDTDTVAAFSHYYELSYDQVCSILINFKVNRSHISIYFKQTTNVKMFVVFYYGILIEYRSWYGYTYIHFSYYIKLLIYNDTLQINILLCTSTVVMLASCCNVAMVI